MRITNIILSLLLSLNMKAQEMWGIVNSNYGGINTTYINPAGITDQKVWLDINFITIDAFFENNSFYIPKEEIYFLEPLSPAADYGETEPIFKDAYNKKRTLKGNTNALIELPSFMLNINNQGFGFKMTTRQAFSLRGVEFHSTKFMYEGLDYEPQHNKYFELRGMRTSALVWTEFAFSYAQVIRQVSDRHLSIGVTLKKIQGMGGAIVNVPYANYIVYNDSVMATEELNGELAYSMPLDYTNNEYTSKYGYSLGNGWAVDLGFFYQRKRDGNGLLRVKRPCEQGWSSYRYKIGISMLDIGYTSLKDNAYVFNYDNAQTYWPGINNFNPDNISEMTSEINYRYGHSQDADASNFTIGLPTAVSLQYEWHPPSYWFYNLTYIHPTPLFKNSIRRPMQLVFAPRYEKRRFEISFPISIYEWSRGRFGVAIRFLNLTLGTDYFSSWTGFVDLYGSDIYLSWKTNFAKGFCRRGNSHFHRNKRYYGKVCPVF